jgi:superoxide dismutase, Fe-Mn family
MLLHAGSNVYNQLEAVMTDQSRRSFMQSAVTAPLFAAAATANAAALPTASMGNAFELQRSVMPLPFNTGSLKGLSEKLIQSHWENNYSGSVKALNTVRGRLSQAVADANTPAYIYNGLKREQLLRTGSVVLHELYFANLGGDGKAATDLRTRVAGSFGSFDAWEAEYRKIANGLGGGSGWVVLGYNPALDVLENYWMADHATGAVGVVPLLVLDMYEHAFAIDYGAAAARYIDAFFANIQWDAVSKRLEHALALGRSV